MKQHVEGDFKDIFVGCEIGAMSRVTRVVPVLVFGLLSTISQHASAQEVRVFLFDSALVSPVTGGFAVLVDPEGREIARSLNDEGGLVALRAPLAGRFRLRYERVGYDLAESELFDLGAGETLERTLSFAMRPIEPGNAEAGSSRACGDPANGNGEAATLWREIRKALAAVSWVGNQDVYLHRTLGFQRTLDSTLRVTDEVTEQLSGYYRPPRSAVKPDQLAADGYISVRDGDVFFYAPDAAVLRHQSFLEKHCYTIARDGDGRVGLEFTPLAETTVTDVRGILWVDDRSWELQGLEYVYVNVPEGLDDDRMGGTVEFALLATGAWIVHGWELRLPAAQPVEQEDRSTRYELSAGYQSSGGNVLEIIDLSGTTLYTSGFATLTGAVYDSTRFGPLVGAQVVLHGTSHATTTDDQGRFILSGPFVGEYGVTFYHPYLDSMGFDPPPVAVTLRPGETTTVELATPNLDDLLWAVCPDPNLRGFPHIAGVVRDPDGVAVPGADIFVSSPSVPEMLRRIRRFDELQGVLSADERGRYLICGAVPRSRISLRAAQGEGRSDFVTLMFVQGGVWRAGSYHRMDRIVWAQDLVLRPPERLTAMLTGVVTDSAGVGVQLADVRLLGTDHATKTDSTGRFAFAGLPSGFAHLEVRSVGYRVLEREVELSENDSVDFAPPLLALEPLPLRLRDIVVEAEGPTARRRGLGGFEERSRSGQGTYLTREQFMSRGNPIVPSDLLRTARGLRVYRRGGLGKTVITTSRGSTTFAGPCSPSVFLDNMYLGDTETIDIDVVLNVDHIQALEVYNGATVPARFNRGCGAIVFWTR